MSVTTLNLKAFLKAMLDTDLSGDEVVDFACRAFHVDRKHVGQVWNHLLCQHHGV